MNKNCTIDLMILKWFTELLQPFQAFLRARRKMGVSKAGTRLKTQKRGLPEGSGFSFEGRFVLFVGNGKDFLRREEQRMEAFVFSGEKTAHSPRVGLSFDPLEYLLKILLGTS
jgi:hypothetical protein